MENVILTPTTLSTVAKKIYMNGPTLTRWLQHWRPYNCPFDHIIEKVPKDAVVLDIGCGGGLLLGMLAYLKRIHGGVGFDFSGNAIEVANLMIKNLPEDHNLTFHHLSVLDAWPEGKFDVVTMIDVMHHLPRDAQEEVFHQAAEKIKLGGYLIYKDIPMLPLWRNFANTVHDVLIAREIPHYVPSERINRWAIDADLTILDAYTVNQLWYCHELMVYERMDRN